MNIKDKVGEFLGTAIALFAAAIYLLIIVPIRKLLGR